MRVLTVRQEGLFKSPMGKRFYNLPTLTGLSVFEAAARHLSFRLAAEELNVTTSAVSRQIKAVEEEIGMALFNRSARGVALTPTGEALYAVLSQSLSRISEVVQREKYGARASRVTLACSHAMATMWLMPRMGKFWRLHPEVVVDHLLSDWQRDFRRADVELRIRYGTGAWPNETSQLLFSETLYPVCSPAFARKHAGATAADLPMLPLLHVEWSEPDWTDWEEFLWRANIPHGPLMGGRINNFSVTLQASQDDQGVAVGWHRLVHPLIKGGKLVRFTEVSMPAPGSYYLTYNSNRDLSDAARALKDWLLAEAQSFVEATGNPD